MSLGSVSEFHPLEIEPPRPLDDIASATTRITGTSPTATRIVAPARLRAGSDGARRAAAKPVARPAASRMSAMTSTATPSSWPEVARSSIGTPSLVSVSWAKTQTATAMAPTAPTARTATPRSRSGTIKNQNAQPTATASSEPRE